jgi:DNA-binding response OmpR family regulator
MSIIMNNYLTMQERRKVLIIEDEVELCDLLKNYFVRKEYEVHVSHTINDGTSLISSLHPDIILLDNNLPDGTGWNMAGSIINESPNSYIIFISGYHPVLPDLPGNAQYGIIEKPISFRSLDLNLATISSTSHSS